MNEITNTVKIDVSKTSNALSRKTKAQLIYIILRKDDVEKNLREEIKNLKEAAIKSLDETNKIQDELGKANQDINTLIKTIKKCKKEQANLELNHDRLTSEHQALSDAYNIACRLNRRRNKANNIVICSLVVLLIITIFLVIMPLM